MTPFDWLGTAVRNEAQATRVRAVAARAVQLAAPLFVAVLCGIYAAAFVKALLWGWGLAW